MRGSAIERFLASVEVLPNGCWAWMASKTNYGYGQFLPKPGGSHYAHRFSYEWFVGQIPPGKQIDHLCRARCCVNPEHLEPVTCRENLLRGETFQARNARATHCPLGHAYTPENTHYHLVVKGKQSVGRRCKTCWSRYHKAKAKALFLPLVPAERVAAGAKGVQDSQEIGEQP